MKEFILLKDYPSAKEGTIYVWNGCSYSPKEFDKKTNGGWTISKQVVENNPEWFKLKQQPVESRYEVTNFKMSKLYADPRCIDTVCQFYINKSIPEDKYEGVKKAISDYINGNIIYSDWYVKQLLSEIETLKKNSFSEKESIPTLERQDIKNPLVESGLNKQTSDIPNKKCVFDTTKINKQLDRIHYLQELGCDLISRIFHYGNFKAETVSEKLLEQVLKELKLYPTTENEILKRPTLPGNKSQISLLPLCCICGGETVLIRGKYPNTSERNVCAQCNTERLEQINEISRKDYGQASQNI